MQRTALRDRPLPNYSRGEEIFNMASHAAGGALGVAATALCVVFAALRGNAWGVASGAIFGASMILLYAISSVYHGLSPSLAAKKVMQVIDHCSIFILIAGTYTPFSLVLLREYSPAVGWTVFGLNWGFAALGIILNSIDLRRFHFFSMICYLGMGWCIVMFIDPTVRALGAGGTALLFTGGAAYTLGAVLYALGGKRRWLHSVFHLFVLAGSVLHFLCVLFYVL